jgi:alkaline phosphatase D
MMGVPYNVDQWDGYRDDRRELLNHIAGNAADGQPAPNKINNVVFLTGDIIPHGRATFRVSRATTRSRARQSRSNSSARRSRRIT